MLRKPEKNRLIILFVFLLIFSLFLNGIIPDDHICITEIQYLFLGLCVLLSITLTLSFFNTEILSIKILKWEFILLAFGLYLFIRNDIFAYLTLFNSNTTLFIALITIYYITKHVLINNPKSINDLIFGIGILTLFQILYGYLQLLNILPTNIGTYKIEGTLFNPGVFSNFISIGILICLGCFWFMNNSKVKSVFFITVSILGLSILAFANTRTAWIAVMAGVLYMVYFKFKLKDKYLSWAKTTFRKWLFPLVILLGSIFMAWFLYSYKIDSSNGRILIWKVCLQMIKERPFLGYGTDSFVREYSYAQMKYLRDPSIDFSVKMLADRAIAAFNEYLQITVELGIIGLILFLLLIIIPTKKFRKAPAQARPFIAVIIAVLVMSLFSYPFRKVPVLVMIFISMAAINSFHDNKTIAIIKIKHFKNGVLAVLLALTLFMGFHTTKYYIYCRKWKSTNIKHQSRIDKKIVLGEYEKLYPFLKKNYDFLYNYASTLKFYGEYEHSIELFEITSINFIDPGLLMDMAGCYHDMGNMEKAEIYCQQTIDLIPYLFVPKYRLFLLYKDNNRKELAYNMANEIYNMPIKVYSETVGKIKQNVREYIDHYN